MQPTVRTFVAIPVPPEIGARLEERRRRLRLEEARVRWVAPAQYHLTLRFLGEIAPDGVARVVEAVRESALGFPAFTIAFQGAGAFPDWRRPRVIWARLAEGEDHVRRLAEAVEAAVVRAGFPPADRPFSPHLTLGRVAGWRRAPSAGPPAGALEVEAGPGRAERVVVYESRLSPEGPTYIERGVLSLEAGPA